MNCARYCSMLIWFGYVCRHDDVIKLKHFLHYLPFEWGIPQSPVNSPHKGQWRGALMFTLICVWTNDWVNNRYADDLSRHYAHYDVTVMGLTGSILVTHISPASFTPLLGQSRLTIIRYESFACIMRCIINEISRLYCVCRFNDITNKDFSNICYIADASMNKMKWSRGLWIDDKIHSWKSAFTPPCEAIKSTWIEFLCFQWAEIDMKCICDCSPTKLTLS